MRDANGHTRHSNYDARNQLVQFTNALGHATDFTYDAVGNLTAIQDARNWVTQFVYDEVDKKEKGVRFHFLRTAKRYLTLHFMWRQSR